MFHLRFLFFDVFSSLVLSNVVVENGSIIWTEREEGGWRSYLFQKLLHLSRTQTLESTTPHSCSVGFLLWLGCLNEIWASQEGSWYEQQVRQELLSRCFFFEHRRRGRALWKTETTTCSPGYTGSEQDFGLPPFTHNAPCSVSYLWFLTCYTFLPPVFLNWVLCFQRDQCLLVRTRQTGLKPPPSSYLPLMHPDSEVTEMWIYGLRWEINFYFFIYFTFAIS